MTTAAASTTSSPPHHHARLHAMLRAPIFSTLVGMAWPNTLMMLTQAGAALVETWFVSRLGTGALAGVALVTPMLFLMQNMSQGAMGGGISSAIARSLGAGRQDMADQLVLHALILNVVLGLLCSAVFLLEGPRIYRAMGATGEALDAALTYSNVLFGGIVLMWVMNALASAVRGTGNMMVPGAVICGGGLLVIPVSPCLIFGLGPFPTLGVAGGALALLTYFGVGTLILGWYCLSGRNPARLRRTPFMPSLLGQILRVGALATLNPLCTNGQIALISTLVSAHAGTAALAGYGTAARLEYLMMPIAFGLGAPMVALVGANIGAGQLQRARQAALMGGAAAFLAGEAIGLAAAIWPLAWLHLFGHDPGMEAAGSTYLRIVGPVYGFFSMGFSLYFASQGARRLGWPLLAAFIRVVLAVGGGWLVLRLGGGLAGFFAVNAAAIALYGVLTLRAVMAHNWIRPAS